MKQWLVYGAAAVGFAVYGAATNVDRDNAGTIVGEGTVAAFKLQVGDCFDDPNTLSDEVTNLKGMPCSMPHDNETFAVFDLTIESYPADDLIADIAHEACLERFESFVGRDYDSSSLDILSLFPSASGWLENDREIICAVYDVDANKLVGTAKGTAL
jgi:hypothetical protein